MKKFIALALTLAMLVSCLVFTASAEDSVAVLAESDVSAVNTGDTFTVNVRVTDADNVVGGVQGVLDVNNANIVGVTVNDEVKTWNNTDDEKTIYKLDEENDTVTFAALNSLEESSYATRLWLKVECEATAAGTATAELKNVKASDKSANLIADVATTDLSVVVSEPAANAPAVTVKGFALRPIKAVMNQALVVGADVLNFADAADITEIGVVFYPTGLLNGAELTYDNPNAIVAKASVGTPTFDAIVTENNLNGILKFGFDSESDALKFLGTKVTARVYYIKNGVAIYANNDVDKYIKNGVVKKAALNHILDRGNAVEEAAVVGDITKAQFDAAKINLKTTVEGWEANRQLVLNYLINNNK